MVTEAAGVPVGVTVAGANRNDHLLLEETLTGIVVRRPQPTKTSPQGLCLDKGYDYASTREIAARLRLTLHLRTCGEETKAKRRSAKARRWIVNTPTPGSTPSAACSCAGRRKLPITKR